MNFDFNKIPKIVKHTKFSLVSGGISNQNYRIISIDSTQPDQIVTLISNKTDWWKADKEQLISELFKVNNIPSTTVRDIGYVNFNNNFFRYILRDFVKGKDFDDYLIDENNSLNCDLAKLLTELGGVLGAIHSVSVESYGLVKKHMTSGSDMEDLPPALSWRSYVDRLMLNRKYLVEKLKLNRTYGSVSVKDIKKLFTVSYAFYKAHSDILTTVNQPFLIHYDMLFKNIIVNYNIQHTEWEIAAIIDNEWVSGGDPDVDLIQVENAAYFSPHKDTLANYWRFFDVSYTAKKEYSKNINGKRLIYHMIRSLFYLIELYARDCPTTIIDSPKIIKKVEANYFFLRSLINSGKVEYSLFH